jgi:hypothetical protein
MLYIRLVHEKEIAMHMPGLDSLECVLIDDLARMMMFLNSISSSLLVLDVAWCSLWTTYVYTVYVRIRQRNRHVDHATTCSEHTFWACSILAFSSTSSRIPHRLYDVEVRNFVHADGKKRKKKGRNYTAWNKLGVQRPDSAVLFATNDLVTSDTPKSSRTSQV